MLDVSLEFRKGILFIRLFGELNDENINIFKNKVKDVIMLAGIKHVVLNINNLNSISKEGIKQIKNLRKIVKKMDGDFFLFGGEIKELKSLVNLENELNVFERVVI